MLTEYSALVYFTVIISGSTRLPGWNKNRKQYTKTPKTYTERLAEMRGAQGSGGQGTRLVQRPKPRPSQQERLGTGDLTNYKEN